MKKEKRYFGRLLMILALIFFYLPIVFMMVISFNSSKSLTSFTGFSLKWYQAMLKNHSMMESLYVTILVAILATIISTVIGTMTAIGLSQSTKRVRRYVSVVNDFPLMNPDIVTAIGLMLLFITLNITKGFGTLLLAHIAFCIPYVILSVLPRVRALDPNLADAAMDLGATPFRAILQVIVPEIMPGIVSGSLIAFTMSIDDFIISYFVTGGGVKNLSIMVYTMSKRVNPSVNAISTVFVVLITIILILVNVVPAIRAKHVKETTELKQAKKWPIFVIAGLVIAIIIGSLAGLKSNSTAKFGGQTLHIYMPSEYIDEDMVAEFEDTTGAKVIMDNFDSNEQMYIKVANGEKYDLLIPSDYMIQRLIGENMLQKLDQKALKKTFNAINPLILHQSYDKDNAYSIPYFWGSVGIVYDKRKVTVDELDREGFAIFKDTKFKGQVYVYDSERDSFMMALKSLGYSMNTTSEAELEKAYDWWVDVMKTMNTEIVTDEIIDNMAQARKALGLVYSGDAASILSTNKNMGFYMPKEGTNIWTDAMVIPKNASNVPLATEFMKYILTKKVATANSEYVGYTSPVKSVEDQLAKTTFKGNAAYTPRLGYAKDEVFGYNDKSRKIIADLWSRVKVAASNA
ncbi:extracellular solute-binding protein [Sharpea azabuensis]|uniref:extracellular solute-binding protein n=2 Tax=Sharpea azabuensis TaxID=322505 RepID=UPI0008EBCB78|nr:extracellular solute-binding protein [Sharpea azabuensis]MEE3309263.1 extracellular solute-binding protein [Sharpea azabuensis]SFL00616.1 spermidine/putrescine transport system permease protein [Sharpea azabuensis]HCJ13860.1 spermidine/putrescine ABC transporter substrate-binding protein [Erysipelotrichaceae bacterium]